MTTLHTRVLAPAVAAAVVAVLAVATPGRASTPAGPGATTPAATPASAPAGHGRIAVVRPRATLRDLDPVTDAKWALDGSREIVLAERGTAQVGPRRPFEYAVVTKGPELGSLVLQGQVRLDEALTRSDRDVVLIFNYQSPTRFYYVHLSQDNTIYPHNGIFVVDDADRRRIDDQWDGAVGAAPAVTDLDWHDVRIDYAAGTGRIEVRVDGSRTPLMTATDTTFASGRVGFGSFDNYGRARDLLVVGRPVQPAAAP